MMLAHNIVSKKEDEDIERQYNSVLKCIGVRYMVWFVKLINLDQADFREPGQVDTRSYYGQSILQVYCSLISLHIS